MWGVSLATIGEISFKAGRVEQSNFHDYQVTLIDAAPSGDPHASRDSDGLRRPARRGRRAGPAAGRARANQCDLRRHWQTHPRLADPGSARLSRRWQHVSASSDDLGSMLRLLRCAVPGNIRSFGAGSPEDPDPNGVPTVTATLNNSDAARDLAAMLPLSIQMDDHLRREKTGVIPKRLSERTPGSRTYERGDLGYWRPRNTFVIFYRQDGLEIPGPGIVLLGKLESGAEFFDVPGRVKVDVELIKQGVETP